MAGLNCGVGVQLQGGAGEAPVRHSWRANLRWLSPAGTKPCRSNEVPESISSLVGQTGMRWGRIGMVKAGIEIARSRQKPSQGWSKSPACCLRARTTSPLEPKLRPTVAAVTRPRLGQVWADSLCPRRFPNFDQHRPSCPSSVNVRKCVSA